MYLTLSDVDICKAKEESLKKMIKEFNDIENDLKNLHNISAYTIAFVINFSVLTTFFQATRRQSSSVPTKIWTTR